MPADVNDPMTITWNLEAADDKVRGFFYIRRSHSCRSMKLESLILWGMIRLFSTITILSNLKYIVFNVVPLTCVGGLCRIQLVRTARSSLQPFMNAFEIYTVVEFPQSETDKMRVSSLEHLSTYLILYVLILSNFLLCFSYCCKEYTIYLWFE